MLIGRGDFEENEWEEIRRKEKQEYQEMKRLFFRYLRQEVYEFMDNFKFEYKLHKKMKREYYEMGMK